MKYAVISYWCGEYETPSVWLYATLEAAEEGLKKLYNQSLALAKNDDNFDEDDCFCDGSTAKVSWSDGLARWFEVSEVSEKEELR